MRKWLALVAAVTAIGCGSESEVDGGGTQPTEPAWNGPVGSVSLGLDANASVAKVVVRRGALVSVPVYDDDTGEEIGTVNEFREVFRYVTNIVDPTETSSLRIPVGDDYIIEVISRDAAGNILEYFKSCAACDQSDLLDVTATTTAVPAWYPQTMPTLTVPPIYVGMEAPYDRFTVAVSGAAMPFTAGVVTSADVTKVTGTPMTFLSPAEPTTVTIEGTFQLHPSMLISSETAEDWQLTVTVAQPTVGFGEIDVIP